MINSDSINQGLVHKRFEFKSAEDGSVYIIDADGNQHIASALWLRERSTAEDTQSRFNHQRLVDPWTLSTDLALEKRVIADDGRRISLTFSDGHHCTLTIDDLRDDFDSDDGLPSVIGWTGDLPLPRATWKAISSTDAAFMEALQTFLRFGFLLITDVPCRNGMVLEVGNRFGCVRETNFGRYFDVRTTDNPNDQAYTALALGAHTDCNYRDQIPGIQLLHCLVNHATGGESTLVDGIAVSQALKVADPMAYELLTKVMVRFRFKDADTSFLSRHPLIEHDAEGVFTSIHFSPRTDFVPLLEAGKLKAFYEARRKLAQMLESPAFEIKFRLNAEDLIIFDNHRILHGRSAFDSHGERHLQGCYIDKDGPASLFRVLRDRYSNVAEEIEK
uniref:Gamma-butyrobetaine dioxygenase n=1 Tax=Candidatus Kentrum sp. LFY TaxID=2126342 RepID=A0A450WFZ9_9GAMM|nr:MAG: gamma-butyrobetaine dioxygenase [Candidatus Kentron sp. LFY]